MEYSFSFTRIRTKSGRMAYSHPKTAHIFMQKQLFYCMSENQKMMDSVL